MLKLFLIALLFALPATLPARAQQSGAGYPEALREFVTAKAGETVRVWTFFDCEDPRGAPTAFGTAANGQIAVRRGAELQCGNPEQPVAQLFYTPREGFSGEDDAVVRGPRGQEVQIKLWVNPPTEVAGAAIPSAAAAGAPTANASVAAAEPQPKVSVARPGRAAARPERTAQRPQSKTAAKARSCSNRRQPAIIRLLQCEFVGSPRSPGRRRVVRAAPDSARQ
jgi:hypothetical protein